MTCYGCGQKGHGLTRCPVIADMIDKDIFAKDFGGRLVYKNGNAIRRMPNKTYVQGHEHDQGIQSHLIMINNDMDDSGLESAKDEGFRRT